MTAPVAASTLPCWSLLYELEHKSIQEELNAFWHQCFKEHEKERKRYKRAWRVIKEIKRDQREDGSVRNFYFALRL
jgi:ribulose bisphosphate carboxylase small subunit